MTSTLHPTELEERARRHYRSVYGHEPDQSAIVDHGSPVLRENLLTEMRERMANARREVQARHRREQKRDQATAAEQAAHEQAAAVAFEADLRDRFTRQFPGAPESDYVATRRILLAQVADERRVADRDAMAEARRRVSL